MRLVTRSDFDGLACAALLVECGVVDEYLFVHPKDVQDGLVEVNENDVLANVPYVQGCGLWFDHHSSERQRLNLSGDDGFKGASREAPSCARVIYDYYKDDQRLERFVESGLLGAVDKADSAAFTREEILKPEGWILLSFIMDARTGLGRYRDYRISNLDLMKDMIGYCRSMSVVEILEVEDVRERVQRYFAQEQEYRQMIEANSFTRENVLVIDLRKVDEIKSGNRFIEYAVFPEQNVSVRIIWGKGMKNVVFTVGYSILNRTCKSDVGALMLRFGGGGHKAVGTCQVDSEEAEQAFEAILNELISKG